MNSKSRSRITIINDSWNHLNIRRVLRLPYVVITRVLLPPVLALPLTISQAVSVNWLRFEW